MATSERVELTIEGMDCADCVRHVRGALCDLAGVSEAEVLLAAGRARVEYDPRAVTLEDMRRAVAQAGYAVGASTAQASLRRRALDIAGWGLLTLTAGAMLLAMLAEQLGLLEGLTRRLPAPVLILALISGGYPIFRNVAQAALRRQFTSHTLMTIGVLAALAIGELATATLIVFFMRFAAWLEQRTTERSRDALAQLTSLAPQTARVLREGQVVEVAIDEIEPGEILAVRPGERVPADGVVTRGSAPVDQSSITGESLPVEVGPGDQVYAATVVQAGYLELEVSAIGSDSTFGRIVRLVEEAETHRAPVQRFADRFSARYAPVVLSIAVLNVLLTQNIRASVAVLVVACSCAIAMATPVVVLASVGRAARRGMLLKGGATLERLAEVDTIVFDKTGTLTLGRPLLNKVVSAGTLDESELLSIAAALERYSEHPLGRAVVEAAEQRSLERPAVEQVRPLPGRGITGTIAGREWMIGARRLLIERGIALPPEAAQLAAELEQSGASVFFIASQQLEGLVCVADELRPNAQAAIASLQMLGLERFLLLTGDNQRVAAGVAERVGIDYRAGLLPEEKIALVRKLQAQGRRVLMVGDGINDAPALAQADVGIAMGGAGTAVAVEAADGALLNDDLSLLPLMLQLSRRARGTIRQNLGFTALYNITGITLAVIGLLPPALAAAAQSLPDVAIMLNSARLLRDDT